VDDDRNPLHFAVAEPGATGLELLRRPAHMWGGPAQHNRPQPVARCTTARPRTLGIAAGRIAPAAPADLVLFDPEAPWRVSAQALKSQGKNTPFLGLELVGRVRATLVAGAVVYEA
jgi:dihydroorotase